MAAIVAFSPPVHAGGIGALQEVGRSMADINAALESQTKVFNRVKSAVDRGEIGKGMPKEEINRKYGEPVIANDDSATGRDKWVYMPASSTFFKGIRIYLYFDSQGKLDEIQTLS